MVHFKEKMVFLLPDRIDLTKENLMNHCLSLKVTSS